MTAVSAELAAVFRDVFEDDTLAVSRETTAAAVPGWDSLRHVSLVLAVERAFGIRFSSAEVAMLQDAGELQDLVTAKLQRR
jgi:acyl carrier protein